MMMKIACGSLVRCGGSLYCIVWHAAAVLYDGIILLREHAAA